MAPAQSSDRINLLATILKAGAIVAGIPTEVWTLPPVAKVIRNEFGAGCHPGHVSKVLEAIDFTCQHPSRRPVERHGWKIRHWERHNGAAIEMKRAAMAL